MSSREKRLVDKAAAPTELLASELDDTASPVGRFAAADYTAYAGLQRMLGLNGLAEINLEKSVHHYLDAATGAYMAGPAELPSGIATRVPASGETPSAEVLALLAGVDAKTADLIRRNLMHQIEYDDLPPGDILLGLSQAQK
jgi:uncharacterized protein